MSGHLNALIRGDDPPLYVVTARDRDGRAGCVVGFVTQCSIYPERLLVCLSRLNHTYTVATRSSALAVHLLSGTDDDLAHRFGEESGDDVDKFEGLDVETTECGAPRIVGSRPWVAGMIRDIHSFGDHVGFIIDPSESGGDLPGGPLRMGAVHLDAAHPPDEIKGPSTEPGHASSGRPISQS